MKKAITIAAGLLSAVCAAAPFAHCLYDAVSLNGRWEMAYQPYEWDSLDQPVFTGVPVEKAVPGYWEDLVPAFRQAGLDATFRIHPHYEKLTFPITGYASDLKLPNILGCFFYRRTVELDRTGEAVLAFAGVRNQVHLWVNGRYVAFRAGFSTPFELRIPRRFLKKGANEFVMAVSNNPNLGYCGAYVTGLSTRAVHAGTGGISGALELRFPRNGLSDVYVTTAADLKTFTIHVSGVKTYAYEIADGTRIVAKGSARGNATLKTDGYTFWSPENPKRYELKILTPEGAYRQKFGIRRLTVAGEKFKLNGRSVYLRGITEHCYYAETVHLPRDLDAYRRMTAKRKELGFNFLRFHTFVPPVEYLEAMDELGMLVHIESPNFVSEPEYAAIISFARRHPCVVIYCTGNETRIDRLAEAYLRDVAEMVHSRTDSLFTPMSAMRGVEYILVWGKDAIKRWPFTHNPERLARLAQYSDFFTSFQLGVTSYDSLNYGSPALLDSWGNVYRGKPRTSHEICIDGSYIDLSLERLYPKDSPLVKAGLFSEPRRVLKERGLLDRAGTYFVNSCQWMWRIRKHCFEKTRAADRVAGFDFLGDINGHWHTSGYSSGMMDEFFRLKPGETVENVRRYNSAAVVLADLGSDFVVTAGDVKTVAFSVSNYDAAAPDAKLTITLTDAAGKGAWSETMKVGDVADGKVTALGKVKVRFPSADANAKYLLKASFAGGAVRAANEWEMYAFTPAGPAVPAPGVRVVSSISEKNLFDALAKGERVLLLGAGPFKSLPVTFRIGLAGRCAGNYATVIRPGHPVFDGLPHEGYCAWQFRRLMENAAAIQLEAGVPFDPIIDIASSEKFPIRQALMAEYSVGNGRLLVCPLKFSEKDPAAVWLKNSLIRYVSGPAFKPAHRLTPDRLRAVIRAPLLSGAKQNANRARNPNDLSGQVRAGAFAQP